MSKPARILCLEPTIDSPFSLRDDLTKRGFVVSVASSERIALERIKLDAIQVVVANALDMAHRGEEICRLLRLRGMDLPVLLLLREGVTAPPEIQADVVLTKPFTIRKVVNRINKLLDEPRTHILQVGDVQLNCRTRIVQRGIAPPEKLTPKQARLLETLMSHSGQVLTRSFLMKRVWQTDYLGDTRTLDVHIRWVREKIEPDPSCPSYILTRRGVGYQFAPLNPKASG